MKLAFGMFVFLVFYILETLLFVSFANWLWGIVFILSLYPSGLFVVNYINRWYRFLGYLNYLSLKSSRKDSIGRLRALREELLQELDIGRQVYLDGNPLKEV